MLAEVQTCGSTLKLVSVVAGGSTRKYKGQSEIQGSETHLEMRGEPGDSRRKPESGLVKADKKQVNSD